MFLTGQVAPPGMCCCAKLQFSAHSQEVCWMKIFSKIVKLTNIGNIGKSGSSRLHHFLVVFVAAANLC